MTITMHRWLRLWMDRWHVKVDSHYYEADVTHAMLAAKLASVRKEFESMLSPRLVERRKGKVS